MRREKRGVVVQIDRETLPQSFTVNDKTDEVGASHKARFPIQPHEEGRGIVFLFQPCLTRTVLRNQNQTQTQ